MEQQVDVCDGTDDLRVSTRFTWASVQGASMQGASVVQGGSVQGDAPRGGSLLSQAENAADEQLSENDHQVIDWGGCTGQW